MLAELIKPHENPFLMQKEILPMAILGLIKYIIQITSGGKQNCIITHDSSVNRIKKCSCLAKEHIEISSLH